MTQHGPYAPSHMRVDKCEDCGTKLIDSAKPEDKNAMSLLRHILLYPVTRILCGECFNKRRERTEEK